jgi:WD40 repeat protein
LGSTTDHSKLVKGKPNPFPQQQRREYFVLFVFLFWNFSTVLFYIILCHFFFQIWDVPTETSEVLDENIVSHSLSSDSMLLSGTKDKEVVVWDYKEHAQVLSLVGHKRVVKTVLLDGNFVFSGSNDKHIKVWDIRSPDKCLATLSGHLGGVSALAVQGNVLYSGSLDSTIKVIFLFSTELIPLTRFGT